jgi:CheY-specific phosphatase CheX
MLNRLFGNYLVKKNIINQEQLDSMLPVDKEFKAKVDTIAVVLKILPPATVNELLGTIDTSAEHFGEKAVEEGYLTDEKLDTIITYQSNDYMGFVQLLLDNGYIKLSDIRPLIDDFQSQGGYSNSQINALIDDDLEQCVNIFVPLKSQSLRTLVVTIVQTVRRLIDHDMYLDKAYVTKSMQLDKFASQAIIGDMHIKVYMTSNDDGLLGIANYFTGDKYEAVNNDALDSVSEFINCINGIYSTNLSYENVSVDMSTPEYSMVGPFISDVKMYIIPIHANGYTFKAILEVFD